MKVATVEERINPHRKRRLRKKLHVGEFKEAGMEILIKHLTSLGKDEDVMEEFLEISENVAKQYGWVGGYFLFSNDFSSLFYINIPETKLYDNGGPEEFVKELMIKTGYVMTLEKVEDAHFPDDDY